MMRRGGLSSNILNDLILLARAIAMSSGLNEFATLIDECLLKHQKFLNYENLKQKSNRMEKNIGKSRSQSKSNSTSDVKNATSPYTGSISYFSATLPLITGLTQIIPVQQFSEKSTSIKVVSNNETAVVLTSQGSRLLTSFCSLLPPLSPLTLMLKRYVMESKLLISNTSKILIPNMNTLSESKISRFNYSLPSANGDTLSVMASSLTNSVDIAESSVDGDETNRRLSMNSENILDTSNGDQSIIHEFSESTKLVPKAPQLKRQPISSVRVAGNKLKLKTIRPILEDERRLEMFETGHRSSRTKVTSPTFEKKLNDISPKNPNLLTTKIPNNPKAQISMKTVSSLTTEPATPSLTNINIVNPQNMYSDSLGAAKILNLNPALFLLPNKKTKSRIADVVLHPKKIFDAKVETVHWPADSNEQDSIAPTKSRKFILRSANDLEDYHAFLSLWPPSSRELSKQISPREAKQSESVLLSQRHPAEKRTLSDPTHEGTIERLRNIDSVIRQKTRDLIQKRKSLLREAQLRKAVLDEAQSLSTPEQSIPKKLSVEKDSYGKNGSKESNLTLPDGTSFDPSEPLDVFLMTRLAPYPLPPPPLPPWDSTIPFKSLPPSERFNILDILRKRKAYKAAVEELAAEMVREQASKKTSRAQSIMRKAVNAFNRVKVKAIDDLSLVLVRISRNRRLLTKPRRIIVGGQPFAAMTAALDINMRKGPDIEETNDVLDEEKLDLKKNKSTGFSFFSGELDIASNKFAKALSTIVSRPEQGLSVIRAETFKAISADSQFLSAQVQGFFSLVNSIADGRLRPIQAESHIAACIHYLLSAGVSVDGAYLARVIGFIRPTDLLFERVRLLIAGLTECLKVNPNPVLKVVEDFSRALRRESWNPRPIGAYHPENLRNPLRKMPSYNHLQQSVEKHSHLLNTDGEEDPSSGIFTRCMYPEEEEIENERIENLKKEKLLLSSGGFLSGLNQLESPVNSKKEFKTPDARVSMALEHINILFQNYHGEQDDFETRSVDNRVSPSNIKKPHPTTRIPPLKEELNIEETNPDSILLNPLNSGPLDRFKATTTPDEEKTYSEASEEIKRMFFLEAILLGD
eukprot:GDKJ01015599.1.p1 GENE.GDKJ01015599.1~~GDKJ01015599.1.p1  ORF type:complete len:1092 (-),score=196.14 GDKJ01015599.1:89-3364(-)